MQIGDFNWATLHCRMAYKRDNSIHMFYIFLDNSP